MKLYNLILAGVFASLTACGGGSSDSSVPPAAKNPIPDPQTTETGVFLDGPIVNIGYRTETIEDVTDSEGRYRYLPGETVTFFIGDLEFPPVKATGVVTPLELAGTTDTSNPMVVNMIRLLQTLDKDGNPDTIEITEAAKTAASQVDFSLSVADFESSTAVKEVVAAGGQDTPATDLIADTVAIDNFKAGLEAASSIDLTKVTANSVITNSSCAFSPGGWQYSFTDTTITFKGSDTWNSCMLAAEETFPILVAELTSTDDLPFNCAAYPVCTFSDFSKTLSGVDGDGRTFTSTYSYDIARKQLTYVKEVEGDTYTEVISLHTANDASSIIGAWTIGSGNNYSVLVFLDNSRYLIAHTDNTEFDSDLGQIIPVSAEYGTYTWDVATGVFNVNMLGQSDGEGGLSDPGCSQTVAIEANTLTIFCASGATTFTKVSSANNIIGAWTIGSSDIDYNVLVFLDDTRYIVAHTNNAEPDPDLGITVQEAGEFGIYAWDLTSGVMTASHIGQSDGEGGLSDPGSMATVSVDDKNLTINDSVDGIIVLPRVR